MPVSIVCTLKNITCIHYNADHIRALERAVRNDNPETQLVHFLLGKFQALEKHLIPILLEYQDDQKVVWDCVKLFYRLTMPPSGELEESVKIQRIWHLQAAKEVFHRTSHSFCIMLKRCCEEERKHGSCLFVNKARVEHLPSLGH